MIPLFLLLVVVNYNIPYGVCFVNLSAPLFPLFQILCFRRLTDGQRKKPLFQACISLEKWRSGVIQLRVDFLFLYCFAAIFLCFCYINRTSRVA